ncbi:hypothetical protein [Caloramator sp. Dgby_cultured_2]|uniref:hypothetical protein n=1 Tax=Caloramator sp. Dgby_cultured_2 TaxID=3029174 RepID=UPI00237DFACF|nr:hypothetical protein [Caloramator sp. Dgby_cultured_2]WDU83024.1 hypothetical protein PWK10_16655 [Caloramator sp. Dgby_cultured_2]
MPKIGDITALKGSITAQQASEAIYRIDEALKMINTPSVVNNVFGFLTSFYNDPVSPVLSLGSAILSFGMSAVISDLNTQRNFYVSILQMYADNLNLIGIQIKQRYIYRKCLDEFG